MRKWIILFILILMLAEGRLGHVAASPVTVYKHFFAKSIVLPAGNPANVSSVFTQDDEYVYAFTRAHYSVANFTWMWYDPSGALFRQDSEVRHSTCESQDTCNFFFVYMHLAGYESAARLGRWRMDLLADGVLLYSDYFTLLPVINEEDNYYFDLSINQLRDGLQRAYVDMTVTIHPHNLTWSGYGIRMPYAANVSAYEFGTNRPLRVVTRNVGELIVEFGAPRVDGYAFILSFDLVGGFESTTSGPLSNYYYRNFTLTWNATNGVHPVPQKFTVALPSGTTLVRVVGPTNISPYGIGKIPNENRTEVTFNLTASPNQIFDWSIVFYNETLAQTTISSTSSTTSIAQQVGSFLALRSPILPLTLGDLSVWTALISLILLTTSEGIAPYPKGTWIAINRKRLRAVALTMALIFLLIIAYGIYVVTLRP